MKFAYFYEKFLLGDCMNAFKILFFLTIPFFLAAFCDNASGAKNDSELSGVAKGELSNFPLKVKNIGLHQPNAPCKPHKNTYESVSPNTSMIVLECFIESRSDIVKVTFSSDGKNVVRVLRTQYLKPEDPESVELIKAAMKFYGRPSQIDERNTLANYGNAYSVSYSSKHYPMISKNETGIGLLIKGYPCGDGTFGTEDCKGKGTRFIRYDLIDVPALEKAYEDGKQKYIKLNKGKLLNQKF